MNIRNIFSHVKRSVVIIFGLIIFISIVILTYIVSTQGNITRFLSSAASDCTQSLQYGYYGFNSFNAVCNQSGQSAICGGKEYCCDGPGKRWITTKFEDGRYWDCKDGQWVMRSACTQEPHQTLWFLDGISCDNANDTHVCENHTYCCPGPGEKWVIGSNCAKKCNPTKIGSLWYIDDFPCDGGPKDYTCANGDTYCCSADGNKWKKGSCGSASTSTPPKTPTLKNTGAPTVKPPSPPKKKKQKASQTPTKKSSKEGCNDNKCQSVAQGKLWGLNNCEGDDPDGDMQICNAKGRVGECGGKQYCCPGSGQKWTADMTACPVTGATLTVIPLELLAGQSLTASWSGIPAPSTTDWLGMYKQAETDQRNEVDWNYVNSANTCTKTPGDGKADGSCMFATSPNIATGSYELRLFASDSYAKVATSNLFTIIGTVTPTPSGSITPTPTPSALCCACPTPTPYYSKSSCNGSCMTSFNCAAGQVCLLADTYGWVCRNPACPDTASCSCTSLTATPTPTTSASKLICNEQCSSSSQCKTGYRCTYLNDQDISVCRNPKCFSARTCLCPRMTPTPITKGTDLTSPTPISTLSGTPTPTGLRLNALPTLTPTPTIAPINPALAIAPFTDKTGKAPQKFTLTGTSDPFADIDIRFDPDSLGQTTTADAKGNWRYILTKSLKTGNKELTVTARTSGGGETQVKQSFTVKAGKSFFSLFIGFLVLACIGGVGFFIYQKQMSDQSSLFSQFPPIPSSSEESGAPPETQVSSAVAPESKPDTIPSEPFITPSDEATPVEKSSDSSASKNEEGKSDEFNPPIS